MWQELMVHLARRAQMALWVEMVHVMQTFLLQEAPEDRALVEEPGDQVALEVGRLITVAMGRRVWVVLRADLAGLMVIPVAMGKMVAVVRSEARDPTVQAVPVVLFHLAYGLVVPVLSALPDRPEMAAAGAAEVEARMELLWMTVPEMVAEAAAPADAAEDLVPEELRVVDHSGFSL